MLFPPFKLHMQNYLSTTDDLLIFDSVYEIIICSQCQYAIAPKQWPAPSRSNTEKVKV